VDLVGPSEIEARRQRSTGAPKQRLQASERKQMASTKTYVLTTGFDQIVTGQELILNGVDQGKHVPTNKHKTIILNANNPGSYNDGDDIEITNLATNNTLNASY
jgi:hypothetical protein